ncbi:DNA starvation/stationary phase protection protein [Cypionkella aquatica]|uniref:DNA starvation/stationary phase protection protein n=1 Tax=Cypionkella aquatica TaxID=1756042 RepID=A0AA37TT95_9RHOB|nr:Dps family protein [Cypionkella aquatica]GLS85433.1 DNA starvation/stationary phase protection protein [Cypionkella aquatica]
MTEQVKVTQQKKSDQMNVVPKAERVHTGVKDAKALAEALSRAVADTYRLIFKTHAYHWNVEGPLFYSVHNMTDAQYNEMFPAADELAERIRSLGQLAPHSFAEVMKMSVIKDLDTLPTTQEMIEDLAKDHEAVASGFHDLFKLAEENRDPVTSDLATRRAAFHEQAAWMLRATVK